MRSIGLVLVLGLCSVAGACRSDAPTGAELAPTTVAPMSSSTVVSQPVPTVPPTTAPPVVAPQPSDQELTEFERQLDEIDQILGELDADLARD